MYLSLLQIKNFRCFDGNEHSITFKKGLNVLVGENDSGKSAIMDAIKLVLGTTDMNWYRVEQEDFYKEDATLEIKITCKFEKLNEDERGAFLECLSYEDDNKKIPCLYLHWTCRYLSSFHPPRPVVNVSTGIEGNGPSPSAEARELLRATYLRALREAYSEMQAGRHSRLSQIMQHISVVDQGVDEYEEGIDIHNLSIAGIADLSNTLLAKHPALDSINEEMTTILQEKMLLKKDNIRTRLEVTGSNSNKIKKEMALLEKLDLAVDKDASDMCGRVGLGTSNIMSMACELLLHNEAIPTEDGMKLITVLPDMVKSPKLTADWENALTLVAKGEMEREDIMADIEAMVSDLVHTYHEVSDEQKKMFAQEQKVLGKCPNCGGEVVKGKYGAFCKNKCGMNVSRIMGVALSDEQVESLLAGKKTLLKGLTSKAGKKYDAYIIPSGTEEYHYTKDGEEKSGAQFKFVMEFPNKKFAGKKK